MANEELKERIEELEDELKNTKVNKRTEMAVGQLKAKIAKLKEELEAKSSKGTKGEGYAVKKEGDATIGLLGKPSVGKSTLLSKITNKESKIGAYEFTTLEVVPGLLNYNHTNLQILDLPGIIDKASDNRGFGRKVLSVVRVCDLVVFIVDAKDPKEMDMLINETHRAGIRVNKNKPFIEVKRTFKGGISVPINKSEDKISYDIIKQVMNDNKIINGEVLIHEEGLGVDDLLDSVYGNVVYIKGAICMNKIDKYSKEDIVQKRDWLLKNYPNFPLYGISAEADINLEGFKEFVWRELGFIWIYLKEQKKEPDFDKPMVLKVGSTINDVVLNIHKDFIKKFRFAKVKGDSVKFEWQRVGIEHVVFDKDIIEIYAR